MRPGYEKYQVRHRYLYALLFPGGRCYVGQTVATKRRWNEHRRVWGENFRPVILASIDGTYSDAEQYEYAWRYCAHRQGWSVYGMPGVRVSPARRMNAWRYQLAQTCVWPEGKGQYPDAQVVRWIVGAIIASLIYAGWKLL